MTDMDSFDAIMLVTYQIRPDANVQEYEDWLRRVDNPFFNSSPLAERYVNWKFSGDAKLFAPNTYFDLWDMSSPDRFGPIRSEPGLNVFRAEWHRLWGFGGEGQAGVAQGFLCQRVHRAPVTRSARMALLPAQGDDALPGWQTWTVSKTFRGTNPGLDRFHNRFLAAGEDAAALLREKPGAILAEVVAAPAH